MTRRFDLVGLLVLWQVPWHAAIAQTVTSGLVVLDTVASLRGYVGVVNAGTTYYPTQIMVSNYANANDGGGGLFFTDGSPCAHSKTIVASGWTAANPISYSSASSNVVGLSTYTAPSGIAPNDAVISQDTTHSTVTLAYPPTAPNGAGGTIFLSCDNGGSVIGVVNGSLTLKYTRQNSNYTPREWGAVFNSGTDDAFALSQWLNASQPHLGGTGTTYIGSPLICPDQVAIEGPAGPAVAEDTSILPPFVIQAYSVFKGGMMLLMPSGMSCAIHSVGIIAPSNNFADAIDAFGKSDLIDQHSFVQNGYYNVRSGSPGAGGGAANLEIYDSSLTNAGNINALVNSPNARMVRSSFAGSGGFVSPGVTGSSSDTLSTIAPKGTTTLQFGSFNSPIPGIGMAASGTNIDPNAIVSGVNTGLHTVTLSLATTGTIGSGTTITFAAPTGENIRFSSTDGLISHSIIQQGAGDGVVVKSARSVRLDSDFFDNNGKTALGTGGVAISNSGEVSLIGNTFAENGAADQLSSASGTAAYSAHIHFNGSNDNVNLTGNVYIPLTSSGNNSAGTNSGPSSVLLHPDYIYDVAPGSTFSNTVIADTLAIQNLGVLTPGAMPFLANSLPTRPPANFNSGVTVMPTSGTVALVNVSAGSVLDSTNQVLINAGTICQVNLGVKGDKGRDAGSTAAPGTYNLFIIAGLNGANASCVASLATTPSFAAFSPAPIAVSMPGTLAGGVTNGTGMIYNVGSANANNIITNPLSGVAVGDTISSTTPSLTATVAAIQPFNLGNVPATIAAQGSTYNTGCINSFVSLASVGTFWASQGMAMAGTGVPANTTIAANGATLAIGGGNTLTCPAGQQGIVLSGTTAATGATSISFGGAFSIFLTGAGTVGSTPTPLTFKDNKGYFRQVGTYVKTS